TLQRELTNTVSVEVAYVGNTGHGFIGDNPAANVNQASIVGFGTLSQDQRKPFFACGVRTADGLCGNYGWTQGIDYFSNRGRSRYHPMPAKITKRFSGGYSLLAHSPLQSHKNNDGDYFFIDPNVNYGPANFIRKHVFVLAGTAELPFARNNAILGGGQGNTNVTLMSGPPFNVSYRDAGSDRDTAPSRPNPIRDPPTRMAKRPNSPQSNPPHTCH